jgi:hypothetical protein
LLQQNERVPHIVRIGLGPHRQHRADAIQQPSRPSAGLPLPRISFLNAHAVSMSPGVCHTRCNGARPFLAAAGEAPFAALNSQLPVRQRRDVALKTWGNRDVQLVQILSARAECRNETARGKAK